MAISGKSPGQVFQNDCTVGSFNRVNETLGCETHSPKVSKEGPGLAFHFGFATVSGRFWGVAALLQPL